MKPQQLLQIKPYTMNQLKHIAAIALLFLMTCCINQGSEKSSGKKYTTAELIGKWKLIRLDESGHTSLPNISFIQLINDGAAEIQMQDSTGVRKVSGKWQNGFKKEIKSPDVKFESDIKISFRPAFNESVVILLQLSEENGKTVMTSNNYKFEKE